MNKRIEYRIEKNSRSAMISCVLMLLAMLVRVGYYCVEGGTVFTLASQCILPAVSCILVVVFVLFCREIVTLTSIPVIMGVIFFIIKAFDFKTVTQTAFCITLYTAVAVIHSLVVFGIIRNKRVLYFLYGLPFLAHVLVEDMVNFVFASPRPPFAMWLPELSVLFIMAGLFFLSLSFVKKCEDR